MYEKCELCPRKCGVDRNTVRGFCGAGGGIAAAKAYLHRWEEPCISGCENTAQDGGERGSGAIFFSNCQLQCPYCQNYEISRGKGFAITTERLSEIMLELQRRGAYNINLVSPTPYVDQIIEAIDQIRGRLFIPVAVNSGGYERVSTIRRLHGYISIYLPDIKFFSPALSGKYLAARDYFEQATRALREMIRSVGEVKLDENGIMRSGVIVRHLVMPSHSADSIEILRRLKEEFGAKSFLLSLMSQYVPCGDATNYPAINRRITTYEYEKVRSFALECGFDGYMQQRTAAQTSFIPVWDGEGL